MVDLFKVKWKASLFVGIYSAIVLYIFDPFQFVGIGNRFLAILIAAALLAVLSYSQFLISERYDRKLRLIVRSFSDLISSVLTGMMLWTVFGTDSEYLIVYISAFMILPLPIIAFRVLLFFMIELNDKILITIDKDNNTSPEEQKIQLTNEGGKVLLNVKPSDVICFEANDNYVVTFYLSGEGELKKSMERISLKKVEEILNGIDTEFQRVHKSYIVNPIYVEKITGRSQAYKLKITYLEELVPVSRSFDIESIKP